MIWSDVIAIITSPDKCHIFYASITKDIMTANRVNSQKYIYESIYENCEEGIIVANKSGKITLANNSAHAIFGYLEGELKDQNLALLIPSNHRQNHSHNIENYHVNPSPRKMGVGRDLRGLKKNGEEFPVEISLSSVRVEGELHSMAFIIDISSRKQMEEALKASEKQLIQYASGLEERVKNRTEQLDLTIIELENLNQELATQIVERKSAELESKKALLREKELSELKSRFVSMASHEFRTPLSTILSSATLIDRYKTEQAAPKRAIHVNKIKSSISNLTHILNDFLSLSKLEEGKIHPTLGNTNLENIVSEVLEELSSIKKDGQLIYSTVEGENLIINSDGKIIKNILINLLSNAIKYSDGKITLKVNGRTNFTTIIVQDEGIGISKEDQVHLFERFFRAKNVINIQGTGLGLNIVKKYVEELNGEITFTSELGVGTLFKIDLPIIKK